MEEVRYGRGHDSAEAIGWIKEALRRRPEAQPCDFALSAGVSRRTVTELLGSSPRPTLYAPTYARIMSTSPEGIRVPPTRVVSGAPARHIISALTSRGWTRREIAGAAGISGNTIAPGNLERVRVETVVRLVHARRALDERSRRGAVSQYVPSFPMLRRVEALMSMGWDREEIANQAGASQGTIRTRKQKVARSTAQSVAETFERLRFTLGGNDTTRRRAKRLGYAPWSAWPNGSMDVEGAVPDWKFVEDKQWGEAIRERYESTYFA